MQSFLSFWEKKYKHMWDQGDKEAYIRRYEKAQKPLSSFEADIQKYLGLQARSAEALVADTGRVERQHTRAWRFMVQMMLQQATPTACCMQGWV